MLATIDSDCSLRHTADRPGAVDLQKPGATRAAKIVYIGQFSALAIALGIGVAMASSAGAALADTGGASSQNSSAEGAGPSTASADSGAGATTSSNSDDGDSGAVTTSAKVGGATTDPTDDTVDSDVPSDELASATEAEAELSDSETDELNLVVVSTDPTGDDAPGLPYDPNPGQNSVLLTELASTARPRDPFADATAVIPDASEPAVAGADNAAGVGDIVVEAESMAISGSSRGRAYDDGSASGGEAVVLEKNSTASVSVALPAFTGLVVRARGDQFLGAPKMTVSVDGEVVSTISVSEEWTDYSVPVTGEAGTHTVSIAFVNDLYLRYWGDRNLIIDSVTAVAVTAPIAEASAARAVANAAASPGSSDVVVEADSMKVSPKRNGRAYDDGSASGGRALVLEKNSTASASVALPAFTGLVIRASGDQFVGAPEMTVSVDGEVVSTVSVSSATWTDYWVPVTGEAGAHTVSVAFTNDLRVKRWGDRNLRLDTITVVAAAVPEPPEPEVPPDPEVPPTSDTPGFFQGAGWLWDPIVANPQIAANSDLWVSYLSDTDEERVANLYRFAVGLVDQDEITDDTPRYDVTLTKRWGSDPFGTLTVPIPADTRVPPGSDGQIAILDPTTGTAFGIWQAKFNAATNTWSGSWGGMSTLDGTGVDHSGSATATNIARYAGVITADEFSAAIDANTGLNHALVFSTDIAGAGYVGPATKGDGANLAGVAVPIPEGYRVQLDPSLDVDAIAGITAGEKVIAKTLQTHGAYVVDQGGARMAFSFELLDDATSRNPGAVWSDAGLAWDYYDMDKIPWSQLRVIASPAETAL